MAPLGRREAVLSSRIEGTQASLQQVLEYEADPQETTGARFEDILEIINYRRAMSAAVEELKSRPLSLNLLKRAHFLLMDSVRGRDKRRGEFRRGQVHIGTPGTPVHHATYVPPAFLDLPPLLDNFERYLHRPDGDPVAQAGIAHAQFELIHPFEDGNGRLGRMLIPLFLFSAGALSTPAFYVSAYLEEHRDTYYARLQGLSTDGDWQAWVDFFLRAVTTQAEEDTERAKRILALYDEAKAILGRVAKSQFAIQALDPLFTSPVFSTPQFAAQASAPRASLARLLTALVEAGLLVVLRKGRGRRAQIYAFPRLLEIVDTERRATAGPREPQQLTLLPTGAP